MGLVWWRLEMAAPAELEESLLWKLPLLGVPRVALQHPPGAPERRQLLAWLPESDWPADQKQQCDQPDACRNAGHGRKIGVSGDSLNQMIS